MPFEYNFHIWLKLQVRNKKQYPITRQLWRQGDMHRLIFTANTRRPVDTEQMGQHGQCDNSATLQSTHLSWVTPRHCLPILVIMVCPQKWFLGLIPIKCDVTENSRINFWYLKFTSVCLRAKTNLRPTSNQLSELHNKQRFCWVLCRALKN